jgi:multisubunit Na+/H+ antiporter MnhB subunit
MNAMVQGALVGLAIALFLMVFDYLMIKQGAAERAKRQHKTIVEFDATERKRMHALFRYCLILPVIFAFAFWALG